MAHSRRKTWTRPIPAGATLKHDADGKPVEATWTDQKGQTRKAPVTTGKDGTLKVVFTCSKFSIEYTGPDGKRRSTRGYKDRQSTRQKAAVLERAIERREAGLTDPFEEHSRRPLREHVQDYENHLRSQNTKTRYRADKVRCIRVLLAGIGAVMLRDLDHTRIVNYLEARSADKPVPTVPAEPEWYSFDEAARITGISKAAIGVRIATCGLPAKGRLRSRRIHREGVVAILASLARGAGATTVHHAIVAVKSFSRWLVDTDRVAVDPLRRLRKPRGLATDQRHARAPLTTEELRQLLEATRSSRRSFRGLSGEARFFLYAVAARSGLRAGGLASLTVSSFDLASEPPTVNLQAKADKSGRGKRQPLPHDLASLLAGWLRGKPAGAQLWPGKWAEGRLGAEMIRKDLGEAQLPYRVEVGGQTVFRDFHSLKHHYVSEVSRVSGDDRATRLLASHTSSQVTARYDHRQLAELARKVDLLPPLLLASRGDTPPEEDRLLALLLAFQRLPSVPFDALPYPF